MNTEYERETVQIINYKGFTSNLDKLIMVKEQKLMIREKNLVDDQCGSKCTLFL